MITETFVLRAIDIANRSVELLHTPTLPWRGKLKVDRISEDECNTIGYGIEIHDRMNRARLHWKDCLLENLVTMGTHLEISYESVEDNGVIFNGRPIIRPEHFEGESIELLTVNPCLDINMGPAVSERYLELSEQSRLDYLEI